MAGRPNRNYSPNYPPLLTFEREYYLDERGESQFNHSGWHSRLPDYTTFGILDNTSDDAIMGWLHTRQTEKKAEDKRSIGGAAKVANGAGDTMNKTTTEDPEMKEEQKMPKKIVFERTQNSIKVINERGDTKFKTRSVADLDDELIPKRLRWSNDVMKVPRALPPLPFSNEEW